MSVIEDFDGEYRWLSNFYPAEVELTGISYRGSFPSVEHAYQAAKSLDPVVRETIRNAKTAGEAKRIGRAIEIRPDWDNIKVGVMRDLLQQKFSHKALREKLLATGSVQLIEGNWWGDTFWGVCKGEGLNNLGKLLMEVREMLVKTS